jgi:hypothetical protein
MQLFLSIVLMIVVVGTLGGWAVRAERRNRRAETGKEG